MPHQNGIWWHIRWKIFVVSFVFHCVERPFGASSGGTPKMKKMGPREMNSRMVVVVVGPSLINVNSSLMGSLAKVLLRKVCGNSAESLRKIRFIASGKLGCGNSAESLRKFRRNFRKIFCNDPFPNVRTPKTPETENSGIHIERCPKRILRGAVVDV